MVEDATTAAVFTTYVREVLLRHLAPDDILLLDSLGRHHAAAVDEVHTRRPSGWSF